MRGDDITLWRGDGEFCLRMPRSRFFISFFFLGGLHQVVDVNVEIVVVFDVVDRGLGGDLVDDQPGSLHSFVSNIFDLLTHKALCLLARLPVSRQQVLVL